MERWRQVTRSIGWAELGWGMVIAGVILLTTAVIVGATVGIAASAAILVGGVLAIGYAATHADPSEDRSVDGSGSAHKKVNAWAVAAGVWLGAAVVTVVPWGDGLDGSDVLVAAIWVLLATGCFVAARRTSSR